VLIDKEIKVEALADSNWMIFLISRRWLVVEVAEWIEEARGFEAVILGIGNKCLSDIN
jgi:hypothetical protein